MQDFIVYLLLLLSTTTTSQALPFRSMSLSPRAATPLLRREDAQQMTSSLSLSTSAIVGIGIGALALILLLAAATSLLVTYSRSTSPTSTSQRYTGSSRSRKPSKPRRPSTYIDDSPNDWRPEGKSSGGKGKARRSMFGYMVSIRGNATPVRMTPNYWVVHGEPAPEPESPLAGKGRGERNWDVECPKPAARGTSKERLGEFEFEVVETGSR